ncbi:ABC transporter [Pelomicrobium methylotrophicum]|uniref:ABC transporter n=1 Tax=Pelomicrobium methylotrophicum TaxID=2602750 RepID=A0A5C7ETW8_9PROT|nr:ABC transporter [Pelomicrobium methylotrophicum]TXF11434.1 ABC transporter [Pelomicrobium methylotrophicum]
MDRVPGTISLPVENRRRRRHRRALLAAVLAATGALIGADLLVSYYQERLLASRNEARTRLERLAWFHLRADVQDITYTPDGKYRLVLWMENAFPEQALYVMVPTVRAFVQVGPQWKEVSISAPADTRLTEGMVIPLRERITLERIVDIQVKDYFELLPGYMHVKFDNTMLIALGPEPKDENEIVERTDNYYVHLKPYDADDERLRQLNRFHPSMPVPIYIGMPPH